MSGIFYGINFVPVYIIQKNNANAPDEGTRDSNISYNVKHFSIDDDVS